MDQQIEQTVAEASLEPALAHWQQHREDVIQRALAIQAIPAPTFEEQERSNLVVEQFRALGLADVHQDQIANVYARTAGRDPDSPAVLVSAHLDTVFPRAIDLTTRFDASGRVYGPGVGDNSLGVAALLSLVELVQQRGLQPQSDIWWVATVGEEGLGDLRGMRRVVERLRERLGVGIVIEGIGLGWLYHAGLGVRRLRISVQAPGGHSWLYPPPPSAIHHLLKLGAALVNEVHPPQAPRSAFNIGLIEGGTSINTRAPSASLSIDLRSVDPHTLEALEARIRDVVSRLSHAPDISVAIDVIGDRPSATLSPGHPLVLAAQNVLEYLGGTPASLSVGSTDANILLARGVPSICVGVTTGGSPHTVDEYIDTGPVVLGMQQLTLLTFLAVRNARAWSQWLDA